MVYIHQSWLSHVPLYTTHLISIIVLLLRDRVTSAKYHESMGTWLAILYAVPSAVSLGPVPGRMLWTLVPWEDQGDNSSTSQTRQRAETLWQMSITLSPLRQKVLSQWKLELGPAEKRFSWQVAPAVFLGSNCVYAS